MPHASLTLTLRADGADAVHLVTGIDVSRNDLRHRLVFRQPMSVRAVCHPRLADCIWQAMSKLSGPRFVFSDPEHVIELPGVVLGKLRVMATTDQSGAQQVLMRFATIIGGFQAALQPGLGLDIASQDARDQIEADILYDLARPILDVLHLLDDPSLPAGAAEQLNARLDRLADTRSELLFHLELLKRYVGSARGDASQLALANHGTACRLGLAS